ncbi:MAG: carboxypeptidase-like regulatory domain-containing protein, partial [Bacteroidota bacterium]|nr:carboxypeptidase-like regulatory domain-containing protein [Bacteroidota bacterium]
MTKFYQFISLMIILLSLPGYNKAQIIIKGRVVTSDELPVPLAPIVLRNMSNAAILAYTLSSDEGRYELSYTGNLDSLSITVSGFNIASQSKTIKAKTQTVDFKIEEKVIQLREVKVKATKIWGAHDTINYLTSSFTDKKDVVIGDVLRKMPGITVNGSGEILFNGRPINKFYIENLDMLQGRYGIAINNIPAIDVSTVQILQNHQPIKALAKSQFSSDAAINLKLKDGAKGTFSVMAQLGIGARPLLGENELTGMYFAKGQQNMYTYKENNSGVDLSNELKSFTGGDQISGGNMLNVQMPASPGISQKRYLFNNSNAATINNLIKFNSGRQFTFNLIYLNDLQTQQSAAISSYYLPGDSILRINEKLNAVKNINRFETKLQYNINEEKYYLNDDFNIAGSWERSSGEIISNQTIQQSLYRPSFALTNYFNLINRKDNGKGIEFSSRNSYMSNPETLILHPGLYPDIFMAGSYYSALGQQVSLNTFQSSNNFSLLSSLNFHKIILEPKASLNIESQHLNSELRPLGETENALHSTPDSLKNNLDWLKSEVNLAVESSYHFANNAIYLTLPVSYKMLKLTNKIPGEKQSNDYLFFEPSIHTWFPINDKISLSGSYTFSNQLGNIQTLYPGYILLSYRNINAYNNKLSKAQTNGGELGLSYKDLIPAMFIRVSLSYHHSKKDVLEGQDFNGIMNTTYAIGKGNVSVDRSINGTI